MKSYEAKEDYRGAEAEKYEEKRFTSYKGKIYKNHQERIVVDIFRNIPANSKVLDLPCGTGRISEKLITEFSFMLTAADYSEDMLAIARRRVKGNNNNIGFQTIDAENIGYGNGSYDVVLTVKLMHLLPVETQRKVLKELCRVSRWLVVVTYAYHSKIEALKNFSKAIYNRFSSYPRQTVSKYARRINELESEFSDLGMKVKKRKHISRLLSSEVIFVLEKQPGNSYCEMD